MKNKLGIPKEAVMTMMTLMAGSSEWEKLLEELEEVVKECRLTGVGPDNIHKLATKCQIVLTKVGIELRKQNTGKDDMEAASAMIQDLEQHMKWQDMNPEKNKS